MEELETGILKPQGEEIHEETAKEKAEFVMGQLRELKNSTPKLTCHCGQLIYWLNAFRCLYCGEYYCQPCAEKHFEQTREEWEKENPELELALQEAKL